MLRRGDIKTVRHVTDTYGLRGMEQVATVMGFYHHCGLILKRGIIEAVRHAIDAYGLQGAEQVATMRAFTIVVDLCQGAWLSRQCVTR